MRFARPLHMLRVASVSSLLAGMAGSRLSQPLPCISAKSLVDRSPCRAARVLRDDVGGAFVVGACQAEGVTSRSGAVIPAIACNRNRHCRSHSDDDEQRQPRLAPTSSRCRASSAAGPATTAAEAATAAVAGLPPRRTTVLARGTALRRLIRRAALWRWITHSAISGDSAGRVGAGFGPAGISGRGSGRCCSGARSPALSPAAA